ncbi:MAG: Fur family transcriptional regulator [Candidatus Thioglobus sp.]|uniref:Fur family transcriptional regulator n=1 Tax=Candidatus Thioglobus sp. TaxID=2026721 RepID=UPI0026095BBB|nr:Fur family transcriptional regulator [Candidatus Thioglobus sp.]MDC9727282.1 Fur family transcriptional regulator [Candidatus Thioglobus sp.]
MIDTDKILSKCAQFGKSATQQRMAIIKELSGSKNSISAYDLLAQLKKQGHAFNISTIYRVLDFWIELGLIHKIESNNTYLVCNDSHHNHFHVLFHCLGCETVEESCKLSKQAMLPNMQSFKPKENQVIELQGLCKNCS